MFWVLRLVSGEEPGTLHIYSHEQWSEKIDEILRCCVAEGPQMRVVTITRKPKEFRYIFLLETRFFSTNGSVSFSNIERIWNHQRHLCFDRHISSISSRATSRFKFERDWRYLFIQIKITKERRCSLHWLRGCSTCMYRSFLKNSSKKIRYLTLYLNTTSQSTSWYT